MSSANDQQFLGTAAAVLGALVALTIVIVIIANIVDSGPPELRPGEVDRIERRIAPLAMVITDESALQRAAPAEAVELSASEINQRYCAACHQAGVLGAPVTGNAEKWGALLADKGLDQLVANAIDGIGQMPARGGNPALSDDDIRKTVKWMLEESGQ